VKKITTTGWLCIACVLAMVGLAFMMWSLVDPRAEPVLIALSLGQGIGTVSLALYVRVIVREYRLRKRGALPSAPTEDPG
jgi:hypothetical protein